MTIKLVKQSKNLHTRDKKIDDKNKEFLSVFFSITYKKVLLTNFH